MERSGKSPHQAKIRKGSFMDMCTNTLVECSYNLKMGATVSELRRNMQAADKTGEIHAQHLQVALV